MKSCLGILLVFFTCVAIFGGGALIWYLSRNAEFSRKTATSSIPAAAPAVPVAPVAPPAPAPRALPPATPKPAPKPPAAPSSPFGEKRN